MVRQSDIDDANKAENKIETKGIVWERGCTDILCCFIFTGFLVVMIGLSGFAFSRGDPLNIITPFDSVGNRCGATLQGLELNGDVITAVNVTDFSEYPYKYFTKLLPVEGPSTAPAAAEEEPAAEEETPVAPEEEPAPAGRLLQDATAEPEPAKTTEPEPAAEESSGSGFKVTHIF